MTEGRNYEYIWKHLVERGPSPRLHMAVLGIISKQKHPILNLKASFCGLVIMSGNHYKTKHNLGNIG